MDRRISYVFAVDPYDIHRTAAKVLRGRGQIVQLAHPSSAESVAQCGGVRLMAVGSVDERVKRCSDATAQRG